MKEQDKLRTKSEANELTTTSKVLKLDSIMASVNIVSIKIRRVNNLKEQKLACQVGPE